MGSKKQGYRIDRRRVLKAAGLAGITGLAGCTGDTGGNGDGSSGTQSSAATTQPVTTQVRTTAEPSSGSEGGKLTYAIPGQSQELNPLTANTPGTRRLLRQMNRGLTIIENDLKPHPWLAKDWSIDGTTYTFTLREGVKFHPPVDREMTAEDVVATFEWIKNNEAANMYSTFQRFTGFEAPDKYTVKLHLEEPFTYTLLLLGELDTAIVPKGYIEDMADQPVGTGPFRFEERKVGSYTRLRKFDGWWKDKKYVDVVEQRPIPEASVRLQELNTGDIDFVTTLASKDREKVQNADNLSLQLVKNVKTEMFTFNTKVEPFGEPKVRKAIRHAVNNKEALELAAYGFGATANRPFAGYDDYVPEEQPAGQDFEKARSLLEEAGYGDGFSTTIKVTNAWQRSVRAAKPIQQWLAEIGIDMQIQQVTKSKWYSDVFNGDKFEMSAYGYTGTPDGPYVNMHDLFHTDGLLNVGYWSNQEMDKHINKIARVPNGPERAQATRNAMKVAYEEVPKFSMFFHHFLAAKRSNVQNPLYWGPAELRLWRNPLAE